MVSMRHSSNGCVSFAVVRHGETQFNIQHLVQGWCDSPLTEKGIEDAKRLARGLKPFDFTAAYASDSGRAASTLGLLLDQREAPVDPILTPKLREWCYGDLEGGPGENLHRVLIDGFGSSLSSEEYSLRLPEVADVLADRDSSGRAERFPAIEARLTSFFTEAAGAAYEKGGGNVLVVTHAFAIKALVYLFARERVAETARIENVSVTEVIFDGQGFRVGAIGDGSYSAL